MFICAPLSMCNNYSCCQIISMRYCIYIFITKLSLTPGATYSYQYVRRMIYLSRVICTGSERSLLDCSYLNYTGNSYQSNVIEIHCQPGKQILIVFLQLLLVTNFPLSQNNYIATKYL